MSFFKKVKKLAVKGVKAYAAYQTGGLSQVALNAVKKKPAARVAAAAPMMMQALSTKYGGGISAVPAAFSIPKVATRVLPALGAVARRVPGVIGTAANAITVGSALTNLLPNTFTGKPRKRYRRVNPANIKALRRSIRRIKGAEKLFRQVLTVQGKQHAGVKPKAKASRR